MKFRTGDEVVVIAGADKGARGKIIKIDREKNKVIVEGVAKVWKHVRRSNKNPQGGRLNKEMPVSASNVMLVDPSTGEKTKVGFRFKEDGSKERFARASGNSLGVIAPPRASHAKK